MQNINRQIFNDDDDQPAIQSHNKKLLRQMITYSPISCIMMVIILIMFLLCEITDVVNGKLNFAVISATTLIRYGANYNILVNSGQVYRLVTAIFLHGGMLHLLANSGSFFMFLMPVQKRTSSKLLFIFVVIFGGILGNMLPDIIANMQHRSTSGVGASTSICSVMGFDFAYRILRVNNQPLQTRRILISLFYLFLISIMPGVDFQGHFGSLIAGLLIGFALLRGSYQYWEGYVGVIRVLGVVGFVGYAVGMVVMLVYSAKNI